MQQLLRGYVHLLSLAVRHRDLLTFVPGDLLAVGPGLGGAVGRLLNLTGEGVGHLGPLAWCRFMVPQLLLVGAGHIRHNKLHILGHQLALLPCHRLTVVSSSPDLLSIIISLPQCYTILFLHSGSSFW